MPYLLSKADLTGFYLLTKDHKATLIELFVSPPILRRRHVSVRLTLGKSGFPSLRSLPFLYLEVKLRSESRDFLLFKPNAQTLQPFAVKASGVVERGKSRRSPPRVLRRPVPRPCRNRVQGGGIGGA
ncbi:hypothetical protein NL676_030130 [Syzygium grande]|nr:hypothetical protein NL676_030130 [Syzygium grande]